MSENQRIQARHLLQLLQGNPEGLKEGVIRRKLAIGSKSTFYRIVKTARETFRASIDVHHNTYILEKPFTLPDQSGLVLSDDELICLATLQHIISCMTAGTLSDFFVPLNNCGMIVRNGIS